MSERKIFRGVGATVVSVKGTTRCAIYVLLKGDQTVNFEKLPLEIDLALSPLKAGQASWADVIVDDRGVKADGKPLPRFLDPADLPEYGATSIGPDFPALGCTFGGVYLEDSFYNLKFAEHINPVPPQPGCAWPPPGHKSYELMTVAYSKSPANGDRAGRRYAGVHARVEATTPLGKAAVTIFAAGKPNIALGTHILDLEDVKVVDLTVQPVEPGESLIQNVAGSEGGVFIELALLASLPTPGNQRPGPKLPIGHGG